MDPANGPWSTSSWAHATSADVAAVGLATAVDGAADPVGGNVPELSGVVGRAGDGVIEGADPQPRTRTTTIPIPSLCMGGLRCLEHHRPGVGSGGRSGIITRFRVQALTNRGGRVDRLVRGHARGGEAIPELGDPLPVDQDVGLLRALGGDDRAVRDERADRASSSQSTPRG